jgi:hypothetical protein
VRPLILASSSTAFRCWAAAVEAMVVSRCVVPSRAAVTRSLCFSRAAGRGFSLAPAAVNWLRGSCGGPDRPPQTLGSAFISNIDSTLLRALAACKTLAFQTETPCSRLGIVPFATGPKRSMGHLLGAETDCVLIRGRGRPTVFGGRTSGILSIRGPEVSLGSLWVRVYMVSRLHRMRPGSGHNRPILSSLQVCGP